MFLAPGMQRSAHGQGLLVHKRANVHGQEHNRRPSRREAMIRLFPERQHLVMHELHFAVSNPFYDTGVEEVPDAKFI